MSAASTEVLIRRIHQAPGQMVVAVTGGGSLAIGELLAVPGGSRTLLEAVVPYSAAALAEFLHGEPEQFCSAPTARAMAMAAFQRAGRLEERTAEGRKQKAEVPLVGIGCTASLASDRPKRGAHRIHVALQTAEMTVTHSLELHKGERTRAQEEDVASRMVINAVAEAFGLDERLMLPLVVNERVEVTGTSAPSEWQELLLGRISKVVAGSRAAEQSRPRVVFPGAFHPLHAGHLRMAEIAGNRMGAHVHFELSIENVDKPPLDYTEMEQRAAQFAEKNLPLWLTRAATFAEKSQLFPGAAFVVGADTLERIGQARYYGADPAAAEKAFAQIAANGCRFLVFGRVADGRFQTVADLNSPAALRKLCDEVPEAEFRQDVSSTAMRRQSAED